MNAVVSLVVPLFKVGAPVVSNPVEGATRPSVHFEKIPFNKFLTLVPHIPATVPEIFSNIVGRKPDVVAVKKLKDLRFYLLHRVNTRLSEYAETGLLICIDSDITAGIPNKCLSKFPYQHVSAYPLITSRSGSERYDNDYRDTAHIIKYHNGPEGPAVVQPMKAYNDRTREYAPRMQSTTESPNESPGWHDTRADTSLLGQTTCPRVRVTRNGGVGA